MKRIATLHVHEDEEDMHLSSGLQPPSSKTPDYNLILRTKSDYNYFGVVGTDLVEAKRTLLVHELGHFVALLTQDPTHQESFRLANGDMPGELQAWTIARAIYPKYLTEFEEKGLESHRKWEARQRILRWSEE